MGTTDYTELKISKLWVNKFLVKSEQHISMSDAPNIVILVLDSARADFIPSWKNVDTFSTVTNWIKNKNGIIFTNAHSHSITSASSMGSLLTGLHPFQHGLKPADGFLPKSIDTVSNRLSDVGYETMGISANIHFSPHTGLDSGFDKFKFISSDLGQIIKSVGIRELLKFVINIRSKSAGFDLTPQKHTVTPFINNFIKNYSSLGSNLNSPFFLVAQYIEPHSPYYPPGEFLEQGEKPMAEKSFTIHDNMYPILANGCDLTDKEIEILKQMYAKEIRYTASMVAKAINYVEKVSTRDTIYVITADHGDLFGEQEYLFHSRPLHNKLTNVPLMIAGDPLPDKLLKHSVYSSPVTHADIIGLLLDIADGDTSDIDSIDLIRSERSHFLTQRPYSFDYDILKQYNSEYSNKFIHDEPVTSFSIGKYKVKYSKDKTSVYNIRKDPREENPMSLETLPERVQKKYLRLHSEYKDSGLLNLTSTESVELTDRSRTRLKKLGYLD